MKDPELMGYRIAIGQILADAGINRETIKEMVQASIDAKVEKQLGSVMERKISSFSFNKAIEDNLKTSLRDLVRDSVQDIRVKTVIEGPFAAHVVTRQHVEDLQKYIPENVWKQAAQKAAQQKDSDIWDTCLIAIRDMAIFYYEKQITK